MASGGSRSVSGPAPDPNSLRSGAANWFTLPADGFAGEVPVWPLVGQSDRESELWALLWRSPQAEAWSVNQMSLQVAFYVRRFAEAELPESLAATSTLVRQLGDDLGLSLSGMARNRWRIGARAARQPETEPAPADAPVVDMNSARSRLRK